MLQQLHYSCSYKSGSLFLLLTALSFFILILTEVLSAQVRSTKVLTDLESEYIIDVWQTDQGLPQNSINAICQTRDGYIWLATFDGLVRFNGVEFTVFNMSNSPELKSNRMLILLEDSQGSLWIGMEQGGLARYKDGAFKSYSTESGLESDIILAIAETRDGALWVGTSGAGVNRMKNGRFEKVFARKGGWMSDISRALLADSQGRFWIGTSDGLYVMENAKIRPVPEIAASNITTLKEDEKHTIWVGTYEGLFRFQNGAWTKFTEREGIADIRTSCLLYDREGILWLGTVGGISRFKDGSWSSHRVTTGISQNNIRAIYQDRENNIWLGTDGAGLVRLKKRTLRVYTMEDGLTHDVILAVYQDRSGTMWFGTNCGGLNRFSNGVFTNFSARYGMPNDCVWSIFEDHNGNLWMGSWGGGLSTYSQGRLLRFTEDEGLSHNVVLAIYEDHSSNLWVGTNDGLNRLHDGSITVYRTKNGISHNDVRAITEDRSGALWIGTYGGLTRYYDGEFKVYTTEHGLSNNFVRALYPDQDNVLWIGTYGGGLNRLKDGKFITYDTKVGLYNDGVFQILEDNHGNFWMSSNRGIFRVAKNELNEFAEGKRSFITSVAYGRAEGMKNGECNGGFQPAGWKAKDGKLWFPTVQGVVVVDPDRITTNPLSPPVVVERLVVEGQEIPTKGNVELKPGSDRFEVYYAGLSFSAPERVSFRYILEGYDKTWINAGNRRVAYYTNIPPGSYMFRVVAANEGGVWNYEGDSLAFELRPFFYQTRWFYTICSIALVSVAAGVYYSHLRRLTLQKGDLERRVEDRTQEVVKKRNELERVNQDLNALLVQLAEKSRQLELAKLHAEEASNAKSQFLAMVSHELRTPLNSVIGFTNILLKNKVRNLQEQDMVYLERILENGKHLLSIIDEVLDLSKIEAGKTELHIAPVSLRVLIQETIAQLEGRLSGKDVMMSVELLRQVEPLRTDPGKLKQILINLIGNAMKFTDHGSIKVRVGVDSLSRVPVCIDVVDSGIGIPKDQQETIFEAFKQIDSSTTRKHGGTGLGLAISRTLSEFLGYKLEVMSTVGKGSTFRIVLNPQSKDLVYQEDEAMMLEDKSGEHPGESSVGQTDKSLEQRTKEQIIVDLQPFSHGAWAHVNINRLALFGRNLSEATSSRQYERFRRALSQYLEEVHPALGRVAQKFQIIRFDPEIVKALLFHADELAKIAHALSVDPVLSEEAMKRFEAEIPKHVDQLLHAFQVMREQVFSEFRCKPVEALQRILEQESSKNHRMRFLFSAARSEESPVVTISEAEFNRVIEALIRYPAGEPNQEELRELSFFAQTADDRWLLEMKDSSVYVDPQSWRTVFAPSESSRAESGLAQVPDILGKYDGDICIKDSSAGIGTSFLLRLRTLRAS